MSNNALIPQSKLPNLGHHYLYADERSGPEAQRH